MKTNRIERYNTLQIPVNIRCPDEWAIHLYLGVSYMFYFVTQSQYSYDIHSDI